MDRLEEISPRRRSMKMIARLSGPIVEKSPNQIIVDIGGLGYQVWIPLSTFYALPAEGNVVTLTIHTHVKEDALALYGFSTQEEKALFERLIDISGIGPRLALAILSGLPANDLMDAISEGNATRLRGIPGVGPKTADRVVLEMRDRVRMLKASIASVDVQTGDADGRDLRGDVVSALVNLGYRENQAEAAVTKALTSRRGSQSGSGADDRLEEILKESLRYLAS